MGMQVSLFLISFILSWDATLKRSRMLSNDFTPSAS